MRQPLHLVDHDEPTRQQIALAEIEQEHRESKWTAFSEPGQSPTFDPDDILSRSLYTVVASSRVPPHRRFIRWVGRLLS